MPFGFDPRKLIEEDKENKKELEKKVWSSMISASSCISTGV